MKFRFIAVGLLCALIAGCGGGDDDEMSTPDSALAVSGPEGHWSELVGDKMISWTVLENGELWGDYWGKKNVRGSVFGKISTSDSLLVGKLIDFEIGSGQIFDRVISGSFLPRTSMDIAVSDGTELSLQYRRRDYEQPANPSALAGSYKAIADMLRIPSPRWFEGTLPSGQSVPIQARGSHPLSMSFDISETGQINFSSDRNCSASGTVQPRASGKAVFDLAVTFHGSECFVRDGMPVRGIAVLRTTDSLRIHALDETRTEGFSLSAGRAR